jgi:hypothetical protein
MKVTLDNECTASSAQTVRSGDTGIAHSGQWARTCAMVGAAVWAGLAVLARVGVARVGGIELMFLFAPLVIVPLGMELGRVIVGAGRLDEFARRLQPAGAVLAVVATLRAPGRSAGLLAMGWMLVCLVMAGAGLMDLLFSSWLGAGRSARAALFVRAAICAARIDLAVGGAWFVASRFGMRPMGIQEPIGLLTGVHFHFAGFGTATIAAATLAFAEQDGAQRWLRRVVVLVLVLPFVVAAGFVISPVMKMSAAVMFSMAVAALAVFLRLWGRRASNGTARVMLQVAAGTVFAGMALAGTYAIADWMHSDLMPIPQMARTHGILNAVGFCLPGLLGWLLEANARI